MYTKFIHVDLFKPYIKEVDLHTEAQPSLVKYAEGQEAYEIEAFLNH